VLLSYTWLPKWVDKIESITKNLIKEQCIIDVDDSEAHLDIVKHVINWIPVILISNDIVSIKETFVMCMLFKKM
jgi:hypothetical protein